MCISSCPSRLSVFPLQIICLNTLRWTQGVNGVSSVMQNVCTNSHITKVLYAHIIAALSLAVASRISSFFSRRDSKYMEAEVHGPYNTYQQGLERTQGSPSEGLWRVLQKELWHPSWHHPRFNPSWHHPSRRSTIQGFFPYIQAGTARSRKLAQDFLGQGRRAFPQTQILNGFPSLLLNLLSVHSWFPPLIYPGGIHLSVATLLNVNWIRQEAIICAGTFPGYIRANVLSNIWWSLQTTSNTGII